jgi:hypothetical protein
MAGNRNSDTHNRAYCLDHLADQFQRVSVRESARSGIGLRSLHPEPPRESPLRTPEQVKVASTGQHPPESTSGSDEAYRCNQAGNHELAIETMSDVEFHIRRHGFQDTKGLAISFDNNRLDAVNRAFVTIYSAQSFDPKHKSFRASSFNAVRIDMLQVVQPSDSGG